MSKCMHGNILTPITKSLCSKPDFIRGSEYNSDGHIIFKQCFWICLILIDNFLVRPVCKSGHAYSGNYSGNVWIYWWTGRLVFLGHTACSHCYPHRQWGYILSAVQLFTGMVLLHLSVTVNWVRDGTSEYWSTEGFSNSWNSRNSLIISQ